MTENDSSFDTNLRWKASRIFAIIAVLYGVTWTLIPFFCNSNFHYDVIEMFFIGKEGVISTFKHPALNSALLELVYRMTGRSSIAPYLLCQCCFFLTAWTIWRLGREFLEPRLALFGVLAFYGLAGRFYDSMMYNHNVPLLPVWGGIILFSFLSLKYNRYRDWIVLGMTAGISFHCKYAVLPLLAAIVVFAVCHPSARKRLFQPGPWLAIIIAVLIALPQFIWLAESGFSSLKAPKVCSGLEETIFNRFISCRDALISIPLYGCTFLVLFLPLLGFRWKIQSLDTDQKFAKSFLLYVFFIPFSVQLLTVFWNTISMHYANYQQNYIFLGPLLLLLFKTDTRVKNIRNFHIIFSLLMLCFLGCYSYHAYYVHHFARRSAQTAFPGQSLAEKAEILWHEKYKTPLPYVTGDDWWCAGNVAVYGKDRATVICLQNSYAGNVFKFPLCNWGNDLNIQNQGGLFLWKIDPQKEPIPSSLPERFPNAEIYPVIHLTPPNYNRMGEILIGVALIPPDPTVSVPPLKPRPWRYY